VPTPVLEEEVRPAPGGSNTNDLRIPRSTALSPAAAPEPLHQPEPPQAPEPKPARRRYHEVDVLRLLAALAVVGFHYFFRASVEDPAFARTGFTDPGGVFRYGYLGVDLFFVISGFVILNSAWKKRPSAFVASRIGRLYPAFWVAMTLTAIVTAWDPNGRYDVSVKKWAYNLTMAPRLFDEGVIDGVYWTLLVELKFYLLILGLCLIGMTLNRVLGFSVAWLTVSVWDAIDPLPQMLNNLLVPEWAPYFVGGILCALIAREGWRKRYAVPLAVSAGWSVHLATDLSRKQSELYGAHLSVWVVGGFVLGTFVLFALIASHKLQWRWLAKPALLGGLTYPLYLLHENIGFVLFELGHGKVSRWVLLGGIVALIAVLSWLLHRFENRIAGPFTRWIRTRWDAVRKVLLDTRPILDANGHAWTAPSAQPLAARIY
jgi:peptidoglycan/LPS O-acetylase OafA/YrhL